MGSVPVIAALLQNVILARRVLIITSIKDIALHNLRFNGFCIR
jgi:hypothetical protein